MGPGELVRFADIDGDKLADYAIVYGGGAVAWWRNTGNLNKKSGSRNFEEKRVMFDGAGNLGANVRLADLDADGRADYLILYSSGGVRAWLNKPDGMVEMGAIAPGISGVSGDKIRLQDYDGER